MVPTKKPKLDLSLVKASSPSSLLVVLKSLGPQSATAGLTADDKVVFTLDDGSLHRTSRALLMAHSTFFANLFSVPPPISSTGKSEPIPLPSVSRPGLKLVLALLTFLGPSPNPSIHRAALRTEVEMYRPYFSQRDLIDIAEAIQCAHIYDIASFGREFVWPVLVALTRLNPVVGLVLRAIIAPRDPRRQLAYAKQLFETGATLFPREYARILAQYAPEQVERYRAYSVRRASAGGNFRVDLRSKQPLTDGGVEGYSASCRGALPKQNRALVPRKGHPGFWEWQYVTTKGFPRDSCGAFKAGGGRLGWKAMRAKAADEVYLEVIRDLREWKHKEVLAIVRRTVACEKCARRLAPTFILAIDRYRQAFEEY